MTDDRDPGRAADGSVQFEAAVHGASRSAAVAFCVVALFVALAIAKPWDALVTPSRTQAAFEAPPIEAAAVPRDEPRLTGVSPPPAPAAIAEICFGPGSWRTTMIERDGDRTVRLWRAVEPRPATGPTDPEIDVTPAVGEVPAIGYCAPATGPDRPAGPASVRAWHVQGSTAIPIDLRQVAPVGVVSELGALFGPPDRGIGWAAGLYVFRHAEVASGADAVWFAVEVRSGRRAEGDSPGPGPAFVKGVLQGDGRAAFFTP
jgi:hypothetical protein